MAGPWERYATQAAPSGGPWQKYAAVAPEQEAPAPDLFAPARAYAQDTHRLEQEAQDRAPLAGQVLGEMAGEQFDRMATRGAELQNLRALEEGRPGARQPDPEFLPQYHADTANQALEGAIMGAAPGVGSLVGRAVQAPIKMMARGFRTRGAAEAAMRAIPATEALKDKVVSTLVKELGFPVTVGAGAGSLASPLVGPLGPLGGATAAVIATLGSLQPQTARLLAGNEAFRKWALGTKSPTGSWIGGLVGIAATQGPDVANAMAEFAGRLERLQEEQEQ